jgi:hypothetical protein
MSITPAARAHRILDALKSWHSEPPLPAAFEASQLGTEEQAIGWYDNGAKASPVIVTSTALWVRSEKAWCSIPYSRISQVEGPGEADPRDASGVFVELFDSSRLEIRILGGDARFRDAWEFMRFLLRVVEDTKRVDL